MSTGILLFDCLKQISYDYLPYPKGDGMTDDSTVIQSRMYHGLDPMPMPNSAYIIKKTIQMNKNEVLAWR